MGKISNYARVLVAKLQDVFVIDTTDGGVTTTKSVTLEKIGDAICGTQVHADLKTDDQTIIGGINELAKDKNIADEYDDTHTYNTGDVTIYGNTLYICNTNNTTGDFDPSKWTATTIDNIIGDLSTLTTTVQSSLVGAVNEVNGKLGVAVPITVNAGTLDLNNSIAIGKAVFISLNVKNVSNAGANLTIASISNTYKPSTYASVIVLKDDTTLLSGWIDTNGSIVIQSTTLNNAKIVVFAQYLKA